MGAPDRAHARAACPGSTTQREETARASTWFPAIPTIARLSRAAG